MICLDLSILSPCLPLKYQSYFFSLFNAVLQKVNGLQYSMKLLYSTLILYSITYYSMFCVINSILCTMIASARDVVPANIRRQIITFTLATEQPRRRMEKEREEFCQIDGPRESERFLAGWL